MRKQTKIKVPNSNFLKKIKDYKGVPYWSFFHNVSKRNDDGTWEVTEKYLINVLNIELEPNQEIIITEILDAKPRVMKSKDGRDFLNCELFVNAEVVKENVQNNQNISNQIQSPNFSSAIENDEDLPF